ncbi:Camphor resistance protein CrcB [metagenome]|uniref:Camphor resistance protein CrcB n=1 Tax=metagenome TaxID=256318 RepID=A0A2P2C025_9ZZZZ
MTGLLVALGAAIGAPLRFLIAQRLDRPGFPVGTLTVNLIGSLLLGWFSALTLDGHAAAFLATGFCGGFTTYSAFAVKTVDHGWRTGSAYAVLSVAGALGACALGFWVGQA